MSWQLVCNCVWKALGKWVSAIATVFNLPWGSWFQFTCWWLVALASAVAVAQANDVVFAEVIAALHFNEDQLIMARVGEAVRFLDRNVSVFARHGGEFDLPDLYDSSPMYDHPVFRALMVVLQAEALARSDGDALDLVTVFFLQGRVGSPWPVNRWR